MTTTTFKALAEQIRIERFRRRLTQADLAYLARLDMRTNRNLAQVSLTPSHVSRAERGLYIGMPRLRAILHVLDIPEQWDT